MFASVYSLLDFKSSCLDWFPFVLLLIENLPFLVPPAVFQCYFYSMLASVEKVGVGRGYANHASAVGRHCQSGTQWFLKCSCPSSRCSAVTSMHSCPSKGSRVLFLFSYSLTPASVNFYQTNVLVPFLLNIFFLGEEKRGGISAVAVVLPWPAPWGKHSSWCPLKTLGGVPGGKTCKKSLIFHNHPSRIGLLLWNLRLLNSFQVRREGLELSMEETAGSHVNRAVIFLGKYLWRLVFTFPTVQSNAYSRS